MHVLALSSDRSKRGVLFPATPASTRQGAYAARLGELDIIGFSRRWDGAKPYFRDSLRVYPTNSLSRFFYPFDVLRIVLRLKKPDVVSAQDPFEAGILGLCIARWFAIPLHIQVHTDVLSPEYAKASFLNKIRIRIARFVLRHAAGIRVVSGRIKKTLQESGIRLKIEPVVLPIYVDVESLQVGLTDQALWERFSIFKYRLLVVSRLEREKNIGLAIRAFKQVAPNGSCLIIVGDGKELARLKKLAAEPGGNSHIFFEGRHESMPYYQIADLVLVPSRYEGYGMVIVEALAAGKPVLSTDVGVAREAGAIIASEKDFADSLRDWFENGPRTGELQSYPYKNFEEYADAYGADIMACTKGKNRHTIA